MEDNDTTILKGLLKDEATKYLREWEKTKQVGNSTLRELWKKIGRKHTDSFSHRALHSSQMRRFPFYISQVRNYEAHALSWEDGINLMLSRKGRYAFFPKLGPVASQLNRAFYVEPKRTRPVRRVKFD